MALMVYDRLWFHNDLYGLTIGGGRINNPGRYLVLLPPINGATAASGTPYFTENPGDPYKAWDISGTFDYMPSQYITFRWEYNHRAANVPYFSGPGGITPTSCPTAPTFLNIFGSPGAFVPGVVVEDFANGGNALLAANLAVARDEERVFIERGKFFQGVSPARNRSFLVETDGIPAAEEQVPGVDDVLVRNAHDDVRPGMAGIRFQDRRQAAEIDRYRKLGGIERIVRQSTHAGICNLEDSGDRVQIALGMGPFRIRLCILDALFERPEHRLFVCSLHRRVAVHDALPRSCIRPEGHAVDAAQ